MMTQLHTGVLLCVSLGLFLSVVALIAIILLAVSAMLIPVRWHERTREVWLVQSTARNEMLAST